MASSDNQRSIRILKCGRIAYSVLFLFLLLKHSIGKIQLLSCNECKKSKSFQRENETININLVMQTLNLSFFSRFLPFPFFTAPLHLCIIFFTWLRMDVCMMPKCESSRRTMCSISVALLSCVLVCMDALCVENNPPNYPLNIIQT